MDKNAIIKALRDYAQATSNEAANTVALPIDLINKGLGYIGLGSNEPVGGSAWMQRQGLTAPVPEGTAQLLGETTGLVLPMVGAAKATEIATALRNTGENIAKPKGGGMAGGQRGAIDFGAPQGPQAEAIKLAQQRAALPISKGGLGLPANNTAAERAAAMGFNDAYHGTADDIIKIDPSKFGSATGAQSAKKAFWTTDSPVTARSYAEYAAKEVPVKKELARAAKFEKAGNWDKYDEAIMNAENLESAIYQQPLRGQTIMPLSVRTTRGVRGSEMNAKGAEFSDVEGGINKFLNQALRDKSDLAVIKELSDSVGLVNQPSTHIAVFNPDLVRSRFAAFDPFRKTAAIAAAMGVAAPDLLAKEKQPTPPQNLVEALRNGN